MTVKATIRYAECEVTEEFEEVETYLFVNGKSELVSTVTEGSITVDYVPYITAQKDSTGSTLEILFEGDWIHRNYEGL
jgi:hypothetical protein